ncbi:hypothetical protein [uncultured Tateyamaria sp.]|uniref:hypothetical protein n=1 Tax=uncultured Tateyamaria sp. TaxID=455651 RepID=UPI002604D314|nr:hypothetical protein [uncultured Tateyamaria sp.]
MKLIGFLAISFFTLTLSSSIVSAQTTQSILEKMDCLQAQLDATSEVLANPHERFVVELNYLPERPNDSAPLVPLEEAELTIPAKFAGHQVTISYQISSRTSDDPRHFAVYSVWLNETEIKPLRSVQSGWYPTNSGDWTGTLDGTGPFKVGLHYRLNPAMPRLNERDYRVLYLEALVARKPTWPDICPVRN